MKKSILFIFILSICFLMTPSFNYALQDNNKEIYNILLVGKDGISQKNSRSDTMIILTVDNKNKNLKLTSLARDTLVYIPKRGYDKLNHAFFYGGCDLLLKTINHNFDLNIKDYAIVDFKSFVEVINALDGVEVNIEDREIEALNKVINACYGLEIENEGNNIEYITSSGNHLLNGYQALAFSRIRYTDSAFHREARHREVAESVYKEFAQKGVETYKKCADIILNNTKTNISPIEMMNLAYTVLKINDKDIEQFQFPLEEYRNGHIINKQKGWVLEWDKEPNLEAWHKFIFGENK